MSRVFVISTAVMLAAVTVAVSLLIRGPVPRAVRPGPVLEATPVKACGPLESLEDLREEIAEAFLDDYLIRMGRLDGYGEYINRVENPATARIRGLIIRAHDCHGVKSATELGVSEEFWKNTTGIPGEVPKREKP